MTKLTEILEVFGFPRVTAGTLAYLIKHPNEVLTTKEIERGSDLRQPEVSIALTQLAARKWVKVSEPPGGKGKGRPEKAYQIIPLDQVYAGIEKEQMVEIKVIHDYLAKLKQAMTVPKPGEHEPVDKAESAPVLSDQQQLTSTTTIS